MTAKILLKQFDNTIKNDKKIDLKHELLRIQSEQEIIFQKKLQEAETKNYDKILKQLEEKFNTDLKNLRSELTQKYTSDINMLTQQFSLDYDIYKQNCVSIFDIFLKYHLKKMNKQIISQEITDSILMLFKEDKKQILLILANSVTLAEVQSNINMPSVILEYITDDTMIEGDIQIKHKDGGISFSLENIMNDMNHIFSRIMNDIDIIQKP